MSGNKPISMNAIAGAIFDALNNERGEIQKVFDAQRARFEAIEARLDSEILKGAAAGNLAGSLAALRELVEGPALRKSIVLSEGTAPMPEILAAKLAKAAERGGR